MHTHHQLTNYVKWRGRATSGKAHRAVKYFVINVDHIIADADWLVEPPSVEELCLPNTIKH